MCGVTRAPFNSNRSSCGIEVVVLSSLTRNSNTAGSVPFQYTGPIDASGSILKAEAVSSSMAGATAQEEVDEPSLSLPITGFPGPAIGPGPAQLPSAP